MVTIYYQHYPKRTSAVRRFYELIGRNVVVWGRLEASMDDALHKLTWHPEATITPPPRGIPRPFSDKLAYWGKLMKEEPLTAPFRKLGLAVGVDARKLFERRHMIVHASIGSHDDPHTGAVTRQYRYRAATAEERVYRVGIKELKKLEADTLELSARVSVIATHALFMTVAKQQRMIEPS